MDLKITSNRREMNHLYRGTSHFLEDGIYQNENLKRPRMPKTTPRNIHESADTWFKERFGISARSQTVFCTPCKEHASNHFESGGSLLEISLVGENNSLIYCLEVDDFLDLIPTDEFTSSCDSNFDIAEKLNGFDYRVARNVEEIPSDFAGEVMLFCEKYKVKNVG